MRLPTVFRVGEGLIGQCALEKRRLLLTEVPANYISISSGLGEALPLNIIVLPVLFEGQLRAVIELASFEPFVDVHLDFLDQLTESLGIVLNTIEVNMRTEDLLKQSQSLAHELQSQQEELRRTNEELRQNAGLLAEQNAEVERKNLEVEQARSSLEEKAEQLALTSKYKSEFLANMSHELRTPLNSLLILAQQLGDNPERNLSDKQIEFANIIQSSGQELLAMINDILDLTKIESGTVALDLREETFTDLRDTVERNFRHLADSKGLAFEIILEAGLPRRIQTDNKRLLQVLRNLLSNAFKFTDRGRVELRVRPATAGWDPQAPSFKDAGPVIAIDVTDSGIGIPRDKQWVIFEAFQQADGTTSRKYGGTGLGLSISRELVQLLGGQIKLDSRVGHGSTFTLYLPASYPELSEDRLARDRGGEDGAGATSPATATEAVPPSRREPDGALGLAATGPAAGPDEHLAGHRVLVVDDDVRNVYALTALLERHGVHVVAAESGDEAVTSLREDPAIEAVLLDVMMPDKDGYVTMSEIRALPQRGGVPIIAVTARAMKGDRERCLEAGATDYVAKPVDASQLLRMLRRAFDVKRVR